MRSRGLRYALSFGLCLGVTGCEGVELGHLGEHAELAIVGEHVAVPVPSDPRRLRDLDGEAPSISGYLDKPADGTLQGAVVLLHGCQGLDVGTRLAFISWVEWWKQRGFATLALDSNHPRNVDQACIGQEAQQQVDLIVRMSDALAATTYLRETLGLPANRIGLQGFSHGGQVAVTLARYDTSGFGWAVALYPGCDVAPHPAQHKPTLVFVGQADDWTGTEYCNADATTPERLKIVHLPRARHLFDQPLPERIAYGHRVGFDPTALAATRREIGWFLDQLEMPRAQAPAMPVQAMPVAYRPHS